MPTPLPPSYHALTTDLGYLHYPNTDLIVASGTDVVQVLQGLVLNDVFQLAEPGSGQLNAAVNNVGRLMSCFRCLHLEDLLLLDLPQNTIQSGFLRHLKNHVITEDAKWIDKSDGISKIVLAGPNVLNFLQKISTTPKATYNALLDFHGCKLSLKTRDESFDVILQKLDDFRDIPSYQMIVGQPDLVAVMGLLQQKDILEIPQDIYDHVRLETFSRSRWGLELTDTVIPLEADLDPIISYDKGCYLGQEIIARMDSRGKFAKRLCTVAFDSDELLAPGTALYYKDPDRPKKKAVGEVIYSIYSRKQSRQLIRAYLKRPTYTLGAEISLKGEERVGEVVEVVGEPLPEAEL